MQLTKSMAIDLAPNNIQVNAILPGSIDTDLTARVKHTAQYEEIIRTKPVASKRRFLG